MIHPRTTRHIAELCDRTAPALAALGEVVASHATRRAEHPVPAGLEADAAILLGAARRVLSREPGWRAPLEIRPRPAWSELEAKLALAQVGLRAFKARYFLYDDALGTYRWRLRQPARLAPVLSRDDRRSRLIGRAMAAITRQLDDLERDR